MKSLGFARSFTLFFNDPGALLALRASRLSPTATSSPDTISEEETSSVERKADADAWVERCGLFLASLSIDQVLDEEDLRVNVERVSAGTSFVLFACAELGEDDRWSTSSYRPKRQTASYRKRHPA